MTSGLNADACTDAYAELPAAAFPHLTERPLKERASAFISELVNLAKEGDVPQRLRDVDVDQRQLPSLAEDAMKQSASRQQPEASQAG